MNRDVPVGTVPPSSVRRDILRSWETKVSPSLTDVFSVDGGFGVFSCRGDGDVDSGVKKLRILVDVFVTTGVFQGSRRESQTEVLFSRGHKTVRSFPNTQHSFTLHQLTLHETRILTCLCGVVDRGTDETLELLSERPGSRIFSKCGLV